MAKYLVMWEIDWTRVPVNAKERNAAWLVFAEMVKAKMKTGFMKDWGVFPGQLKGYSVVEGTEAAVMTELMEGVPFINHEARVVATIAQAEESIRASMK